MIGKDGRKLVGCVGGRISGWIDEWMGGRQGG